MQLGDMESTQIKDVMVALSIKTTSVVHLGARIFYADSPLTLNGTSDAKFKAHTAAFD